MSGQKIITGLQEAIASTRKDRPMSDAPHRIPHRIYINRAHAFNEGVTWTIVAGLYPHAYVPLEAYEALEAALAAMTAEENRLCADLKRAKDRADVAEAALAAMTAERERLALAICGGEDAPGYANAQPVEALEKVARDNAAAWMWQVDQTTKAEARLAKAVEALREIADDAEIMATGRVGLIGKIIRTARATLAEIGGA